MDINTLVIGNGFDIYHGLNTKYYDFVQYTMQVNSGEKKTDSRILDLCKSNMFIIYFQKAAKENQGWIDCELEIEMISNIFNKIVNVDVVVDDGGYLHKNVLKGHEMNVLQFATEYIRNDAGMFKLNSPYLHSFRKINKDLLLRNLNRDLKDFIEVFYYYLQQEIIKKPVEILSRQIKDIEFSYVINFNYTNTYRLYNIEDKDVCFIHGSVISGADSMVLGTRDVEKENLDFIYFRKYFQRIQKKADQLVRLKIVTSAGLYDMYREEGDANVYFFGHSLSNTDGDIIREIEEYSKRLIIYYYDQRDYEQKVINLIDVFGKEKALRLINGGKADFIQLEPAQKV